MSGEKFLSLQQVMEKLGGLSRASVYRAIANGELPKPRKIGNRSMWSEIEIDQVMAGG